MTRKITEAAARIKLGLQDELRIGNLEACRDWGYAPEYVEAMWRMLQQESAKDYVIGTGVHHSVRQCVDYAFEYVGLDPNDFLVVDPDRMRPAEVDLLIADPSKAREELDWRAETSFRDLVSIMLEADLGLQEAATGARRERGR